jgi:hypothetical protein
MVEKKYSGCVKCFLECMQMDGSSLLGSKLGMLLCWPHLMTWSKSRTICCWTTLTSLSLLSLWCMTRVFLSHWLQEGVVLLLPEGPHVPDGLEGEPGHRGQLLGNNRLRQGGLQTAEWVVLLVNLKKTLDFFKAGYLVATRLYSSLG